jgi:rubrerythrin
VGSTETQSGAQVACKKCGHPYDSSLFFCPSCGQRQN